MGGLSGPDIDIRRIYVYDVIINPCTACSYCADKDECIFNDSMNEIYKLIEECSLISISSPVYFSSLPGQLKNLIDRTQVLWEKDMRGEYHPQKKAGMFISTGGADYATMFTPSQIIIKHFFNTLKAVYKEDDFILLKNTGNLGLLPDSAGLIAEKTGARIKSEILNLNREK